ncbi:MAG: phytanoyl-CoA dioxygenase family protein, partial [Gemmatimonadota bacterium]|nr:phytanoyl-CoA dioxygenase family protein [Gemmatimonadota bacterium]
VYLCDIKPRSGGFCVWPGTHAKMADYFRSHSLLSVNRQFLDPNAPPSQIHMGTIIDLPDPMEITGPAGTVIFWHGLMVHSASKNCSRNIRMGLFTRFKWKNWNDLQFETPDDMWEYWEGLNG